MPAGSVTQILPVIVGDASATVRASERALERGVFAQAIRPPTVPEGTSRLRLAVMASHTKSELREAARVLAACVPTSARGSAPLLTAGGSVLLVGEHVAAVEPTARRDDLAARRLERGRHDELDGGTAL